MQYTLIPSKDRDMETTVDAVAEFIRTWDDYTLGDIGPSLTCREAETMCAMFAAFGQHDKADSLRAGHIESDDHGDLNHNTMDDFEDGDAELLEDLGETVPAVAELVASPLEIEA
jgi:hypothetical protein